MSSDTTTIMVLKDSGEFAGTFTHIGTVELPPEDQDDPEIAVRKAHEQSDRFDADRMWPGTYRIIAVAAECEYSQSVENRTVPNA
jgi:hypothetical protein